MAETTYTLEAKLQAALKREQELRDALLSLSTQLPTGEPCWCAAGDRKRCEKIQRVTRTLAADHAARGAAPTGGD